MIHQRSFAELLLERAAARRDAIAVEDGESRLSYSELIARGQSLAHLLAPVEGPVGILLPMTADYIVAIVGALLAGKTYVPMDAGFPDNRNLRIINHSGISAVIVNGATTDSIQTLDASIKTVLLPPAAGSPDFTKPPVEGPFDRTLTLFYTSGSTGEPKGVCHTQSGLLFDLGYYIEQHVLTENDVHSLLLSPSLSACNPDIFATLLVGAKLCIVDLKRLGLAKALQLMRDSGVTVFNGGPSAFRALFDTDHPDAKVVASRIRIVRVGGDRVLHRDVELYRKAFQPASRMSVGMGTTETRPLARWLIDHDTPMDRPLVSIGYPLPGLYVDLLDDDGSPAPVGEMGEFTVASAGLAAGYWRDEALTNKKFRPSLRHPGLMEYRTGDYGRLLPDGRMEVVGRRDRQIKVRGNTLHLGEIEAVIGSCPGVGDVAVVGRHDGSETRLIAYYTGADSAEQASAIRAWCRKHLAPAMCPAAIVACASLPMLGSGKVDLVGLGRLDAERAADEAAGAPPPTLVVHSLADAVAQVWTRRLGQAAFAEDLTFESAGGDSLQAMILIQEVERLLDRKLPIGLLGWTTRPSELTAKIEGLGDAPRGVGGIEGGPTIFLFAGMFGGDYADVGMAERLSEAFRVVLMDYRNPVGELIGETDAPGVFEAFDAQVAAEGTPSRLWVLGYSFGSRLAVECARRLLARGIPVEFTGVIDGPTEPAIAIRNASRKMVKPQLKTRVAADGGWFGFMTGRIARSITHRLVTRGDYAAVRQFIDLLGRLGLRAAVKQSTRTALARSRVKGFRNLPQAPLPMPITLFVSTAPNSTSRRQPDLGWSDWCSKLDIFELEGDHYQIVDDERFGAIVAILRETEVRLRQSRAA